MDVSIDLEKITRDEGCELDFSPGELTGRPSASMLLYEQENDYDNPLFLHGTREEFKRFIGILQDAIGPEMATAADIAEALEVTHV